MVFKLALKNLFYYRGRSLTIIFLTFFSTLLFIVYVALMHGSHSSMLENSLKVYTGAIEIYQKGYRDIGGNEYLLEEVHSIEEKLKGIDNIKNYTSRYESYGLLSSKEISSPAMVTGINPLKEASMSQLKEALIQGKYLNKSDTNIIYMGVNLAKKLEVFVGDEISFVSSGSDNSFVADLFKVGGIFKTGAFEFDSMSAFMSREYFDILMNATNKASYISIALDDITRVDETNRQIIEQLPSTVESVTWKILMKGMVESMEVDSIFGYLSISLFFVVVFFVIMIFGFINVSSRVREFGTLKSIGFSQKNIAKLFFYEIFILSTFAVSIATPIGSGIAYYFSLHPFVMEGMSEMYKEYGIVSDEIPLAFDLWTISWNVMMIYGLNFLSIVYPLRYIFKFKPVEALGSV